MNGLRREDGKLNLARGMPATITVKDPEARRVMDAVIENLRSLNILDTSSPDVLKKVGRRTEVVSVSPHLYVRERSNDIWEIGFNGNPPGNNAQTPLSASGGSAGGRPSGDIINANTITVEGRDADGNPTTKTFYPRPFNFVSIINNVVTLIEGDIEVHGETQAGTVTEYLTPASMSIALTGSGTEYVWVETSWNGSAWGSTTLATGAAKPQAGKDTYRKLLWKFVNGVPTISYHLGNAEFVGWRMQE
jgi:hypothetical protein